MINIYLGGDLFTLASRNYNLKLAETVIRVSGQKYKLILPQDIELREFDSKSIRDADFNALIGCEGALFNFEGLELDSGMVAEFMTAKAIGLPCVVVRTDFRGVSDNASEPWNLMLVGYPQTVVLKKSSLEYSGKKVDTAECFEEIADLIISKLDEVFEMPSVFDSQEQILAEKLIRKAYDLPDNSRCGLGSVVDS